MLRKLVALLVLLVGAGALLAEEVKGKFRKFENGAVVVRVGGKDIDFVLEGRTKLLEGENVVPAGEQGKFLKKLPVGTEVTVTYRKFAGKIKPQELNFKTLASVKPLGPGIPVRLRASLEGHKGNVAAVAFSPDGQTLASGGQSGVKLWNVADSKFIADLTKEPCSSLAFSADGKTLAQGLRIRVWDVAARKEKAVLPGGTESLALSSDGKSLASAGPGWNATLWDVAAAKQLAELKGHSSWVRSVAISPDGKTLASGGGDRTIKLWDVVAAKETATLKGHTEVVFTVKFSPDGKSLASGGPDQTIKLWDVENAKEKATIKGVGHTNSLAFSPDGKVLVAGGPAALTLWDVATGGQSGKMAHKGPVLCVAFGPDGKTIASSGVDGAVMLWEIRDAAEAKADYDRHMKDGRAALKKKSYALAIKEFGEALQAKPNDQAASSGIKQAQSSTEADFRKYRDAGKDAMAKKRYADAVKFFEKALELMPDAGVRGNLTYVKMKLGKK